MTYLSELPPDDSLLPPTPAKGLYRTRLKRALDVTLVLIALPLVVPLIAVLALLVARDGTAPFYTQARLGRDRRVFRMWKLRTMVADADARLKAHLAENPAACAEWRDKQKLRNDPRITRLGQILRRTSLDELPQLFNVLRGDMSLVGPRPMTPSQRKLYSGTAYFRLRPGLTGPWQVSERNRAAFADRVGYDDEYWRTVSLTADLWLILRTVGVLVRPTGV